MTLIIVHHALLVNCKGWFGLTHLKNDHGIRTIGDRPQEMQRKTRLFNLRNVVYKEEETKPEHAIGLYPGIRHTYHAHTLNYTPNT